MYVMCMSRLVCGTCTCICNYQGSPHRSGAPLEPVKYAPPPLAPDEDELEHYKTQVMIMTDLINVRRREGEGEWGWERERGRVREGEGGEQREDGVKKRGREGTNYLHVHVQFCYTCISTAK